MRHAGGAGGAQGTTRTGDGRWLTSSTSCSSPLAQLRPRWPGVVDQFGAGAVDFITADTLVEDEDNWRFAREVVARLGCEWIRLADGRTPRQAGRDVRCVPDYPVGRLLAHPQQNCSKGQGPETHDPADFHCLPRVRLDRAAPFQRGGRPLGTVDSAGTAHPAAVPVVASQLLDLFRERGIEPPPLRLWLRAPNCGGACVWRLANLWSLLLQVARPR